MGKGSLSVFPLSLSSASCVEQGQRGCGKWRGGPLKGGPLLTSLCSWCHRSKSKENLKFKSHRQKNNLSLLLKVDRQLQTDIKTILLGASEIDIPYKESIRKVIL